MNVLLETLVHCNVHLLQHRGICQTVHLTREEKYHWGNRPDHRGGQRHWPAHGREVCPPWASLVLWDVNQEGMKETARLVKEKGTTRVHCYLCDCGDKAKVYRVADQVNHLILIN